MINPGRVIIFDTTLRDGEQSPGFSMNLKEKLEGAQQLARVGVDVIEAGFPITSQGDFDAVCMIGGEVTGPRICGLARAVEKDVIRAGEALSGCSKSRIHTFIATSEVHREKAVKLARTFTDDVEFSCEDAGRTDWGYMVDVLTAAIESGATTVNIPDTVGYCVPEQFGDCIRHVRDNTPGIGNCIISVHCHNDLGHAVANSLAGVRNGARQVECTINGIGERAGNTSLEEIAMMLKTRRDYFNLETGINTREIFRTSRLLTRITGIKVQPNKAVVGANAFAHEAGIHQDGMIKERTTYEIMHPEDVGWSGDSIVMGKHSGRNALAKRLGELGVVDIEIEELDRFYERFKGLCDLKKDVYDEDLLAIAEDELSRSSTAYKLVDLQIGSTLNGGPHVFVSVALNDDPPRESRNSNGDGLVDCLYRALDGVTDHTIKLLDYSIDSVTKGKDALGRVKVNMLVDGQEIRGIAVDTDVITASGRAYLNSINRYLVLKEINERASKPSN